MRTHDLVAKLRPLVDLEGRLILRKVVLEQVQKPFVDFALGTRVLDDKRSGEDEGLGGLGGFFAGSRRSGVCEEGVEGDHGNVHACVMMVKNDGDDEMAARGLAFGLDPVDVWVVADSVGTSQIRVETSQGRV